MKRLLHTIYKYFQKREVETVGNLVGEFRDVKLEDLNIKTYTEHEWVSSAYSDNIRIYDNSLEVIGDLILDVLEPGFGGIIVNGDLSVSGNIINGDTDLGISLCVTGNTSANNLIAGGASIVLNNATIKYFTMGHYPSGYLRIHTLNSMAMLNFQHSSSIENADNINISISDDDPVIRDAKTILYSSDLAHFWHEHNILTDYIEFEEDDDDDESYYYLNDRLFIRHIRDGQEKVLFKYIDKYTKEGNIRQDDIILPFNNFDSIMDDWTSGRLVSVIIRDPDGLKVFSKAIMPSKLQSLEYLEIYNFKIDEIPDSFKHLNQLKELRLADSGLSEIPQWIGTFTKLNILDLSGNGISDFPESIQYLTDLVELNIAENNLAEIPDTIGKLTKLKKLVLYNNNINRIPNSIGDLRELQSIEFQNNSIKEIPKSIGDLRELKSLDFQNNKLTEIPEEIGYLKKMSELDLGDNFLSSLPNSMGKLKKLEVLWLYNNLLSEIPEWIKELDDLVELYLDFNNIAEFKKWFIKLKTIDYLGIKGNNFITLPKSLTKRYALSDVETYNKQEMKKFKSDLESALNGQADKGTMTYLRMLNVIF